MLSRSERRVLGPALSTAFLRYQQICSVKKNQRFFDNLAKPVIKK